jgi:hypothetical protein
MLQEYARTHNVITLSIGGNDFNFASIVQDCLTNWLTSPCGGRTTATTTLK